MTDPPYTLAAILSSGEPERLYSGLSLLVSGAAGGERCAGLAAFRGLALLVDPELPRRALLPEETPVLAPVGRETFARSLGELRDTALELDGLELYACAASVETMSVDVARLDGVLSTPRFLELTGGARLVVV